MWAADRMRLVAMAVIAIVELALVFNVRGACVFVPPFLI